MQSPKGRVERIRSQIMKSITVELMVNNVLYLFDF